MPRASVARAVVAATLAAGLFLAWTFATLAAAPVSLPVKNLFVYKEAGRFAGWPANKGVWNWGNEILVGFTQGYYKANQSGHSIDPDKPSRGALARSLDGGETWTLEVPEVWPGRGQKPMPCPGNIDFARPDFALRVSGDEFFVSADRGKTWKGPYRFAAFDFKKRADEDLRTMRRNNP